MTESLAILTCALGLAGDVKGPQQQPTAQRETSAYGIWPTPAMIDGILLRWADDTAVKYNLTPDQTERLQNQLAVRWRTFLDQNRPTLQPLLNEYVEARLALAPPDPEKVKAWADRALPVFARIQQHLYESQRELRPLLDPVQQGMLDIEAIASKAALKVFEARLQAWHRGEFEPHEWWDQTERVRRAAAETDKQPKPAAPSKAKTRIDEEMLRWGHFVRQFIDRYELDDTQREAAYSILRECKRRALDHRDRYRARLKRLEKRIANVSEYTDEQRAEMKAMYGPVDALFAELESRLAQIPTKGQSDADAKDKTAPGR